MPFDVNTLELEKSFETSFDLPDFYSDIYSMTSYDDSGEEIEVSDDGTFVMPDDDVSIEVIYEKRIENILTNPKTSSALCVALAIISISLLGTFIVKNKKMKGENL